MDYEKKYNEALERAKKVLLDKETTNHNVAEFIFPELAESEDERIRKFLLDYAIEMIAGLESDISLSTYDGIKGHDPDAEEELTQWQKARAYLEKQKEQKCLPGFDDMTPEEKMNHPLYLEGFDAGREVGKVEAEQKPKMEWSEEDEDIFKNIIEKAKGGKWIEFDEISWLTKRFKSLRPQPHWKPS